MKIGHVLFVCTALVLAGLSPAAAGSGQGGAGLAVPAAEDVILTVRGAIAHSNGQDDDGPVARLDMAMLQALPVTEFATSTVWTEGVIRFSGVLLRDLLDHLGAEGAVLHATAIDGYQISMPLADLRDDGPILAYLRDGKPMPLRDKGPLWKVYPFDTNPDFRNETHYARSIWQLQTIDIDR